MPCVPGHVTDAGGVVEVNCSCDLLHISDMRLVDCRLVVSYDPRIRHMGRPAPCHSALARKATNPTCVRKEVPPSCSNATRTEVNNVGGEHVAQ